jgi:hypothetical protein
MPSALLAVILIVNVRRLWLACPFSDARLDLFEGCV